MSRAWPVSDIEPDETLAANARRILAVHARPSQEAAHPDADSTADPAQRPARSCADSPNKTAARR